MSTLAPIPGFTHLQRLEPSRRTQASKLPDTRANEATALVAIALATYFGVRPPSRLNKRTFSPEVIACLTAGKDTQLSPRPTCGPTKLLSSHVHSNSEDLALVGTVICSELSFGYYASFGRNRTGLVLEALEVTATT